MLGVDAPFDERDYSIDSEHKTGTEFCPHMTQFTEGCQAKAGEETIDETLLNINKMEGPQKAQHNSFRCCTSLPS